MILRKKAFAFVLCVCLLLSMLPLPVFAVDAKLTVPASGVTASADDGNVPANTVDGNLTTRWSASGNGQWIQYDLGSNKKVAYIKIAFVSGDTRTSTFDIQTSTDNVNFTTVQTNVTSSLNTSLQTFDFPDVSSARYVRILGHGNSLNAWNSYTEVEIYGDTAITTDAKFPVPGTSVTASSNDGNVPANTVDGNLTTRWSASGDGQWIQYDLGSNKKVAYIKIAFVSGDTRTSTFDILTSTNNVNFTTVQTNVTSSLNTSLQTFDFPDVSSARYVRIVGHSNSLNAWNSYTEVEIYGTDTNSNPGNEVSVSTSAQLASAISSASAGTTIVLANGTYTQSGAFKINNKAGTAGSPITIKAANQGQAIISGGAFIEVNNSSYVIIQGLKFTNTGNNALLLNGSNNIQVTRNKFALPATGGALIWLQVSGANSHHNRIDHNDFGNKSDTNPLIAYEGDGNGNISQYDIIEYNYFHDVGPWVDNGKETIRLGLSGISLSNGYNTIQHNLFENTDGEPEIVSVKSSNNTVRYNTFKTSKGGLTSRHGHSNSFYGNFFLGDGVESEEAGIRIYGNDHKIYNNYMENLTKDAIILDNGNYDGGSSGYPANPSADDLRAQWKIYRAQVVNNTIVNSTTGIIVGSGKTYATQDSRIANNIIKNSSGILYNEIVSTNTVFEGNMGSGGTLKSNSSRTASEILGSDPAFTTINGLQKLSATSPAINYAKGSYPFVSEDMDGETRSINDAGADERSGATSFPNHPLTAAEVGPSAP
ncbi:chondroitinase-B domain-containing protein [Paenibacillus radicis (ex Xue et al. 2023)]|uniref:Discoidin domain-containing protein n=1 Tax=Paenibacillus radicis (ex Xue et al. 2023) TaxID=2972489 RepID=A0ABT1YTC8_9BACL|nr:chondroitinase-B domain-containing protein [Paenibacillus radicis (ex Xue et al. 2023)]MCR8635563.1 discoidin domain-containing protein [Paenibacillus radicis (ex Xue et al. 2023)]